MESETGLVTDGRHIIYPSYLVDLNHPSLSGDSDADFKWGGRDRAGGGRAPGGVGDAGGGAVCGAGALVVEARAVDALAQKGVHVARRNTPARQ